MYLVFFGGTGEIDRGFRIGAVFGDNRWYSPFSIIQTMVSTNFVYVLLYCQMPNVWYLSMVLYNTKWWTLLFTFEHRFYLEYFVTFIGATQVY